MDSSRAMSQGGTRSRLTMRQTVIYNRGRMEGTVVLVHVTDLKDKDGAILRFLHSPALLMFMIASAGALWMAPPEEESRLLLRRTASACYCHVRWWPLVVSIHTLRAVLNAMSTKEV